LTLKLQQANTQELLLSSYRDTESWRLQVMLSVHIRRKQEASNRRCITARSSACLYGAKFDCCADYRANTGQTSSRRMFM